MRKIPVVKAKEAKVARKEARKRNRLENDIYFNNLLLCFYSTL